MRISKKLIWIDIISFLIFIFILIEILYNGVLINSDIKINSLMSLIETDFFINISNIIAFVFDSISIIVISFILSAYFWFKGHKKDSLFFIFVVLLNGAIVFLVKEFIQRPRPFNALVNEGSFAFPSGHAATAVVFFGLLIYLFIKKNKSSALKLTYILISIFIVLLIGISRLVLNVHWFSDVLGGFFLGLVVLISCIMIRESSGIS